MSGGVFSGRLGTRIASVTYDEAVVRIIDAASAPAPHGYVCACNVHTVSMARRDPAYLSYGVFHADGALAVGLRRSVSSAYHCFNCSTVGGVPIHKGMSATISSKVAPLFTSEEIKPYRSISIRCPELAYEECSNAECPSPDRRAWLLPIMGRFARKSNTQGPAERPD